MSKCGKCNQEGHIIWCTYEYESLCETCAVEEAGDEAQAYINHLNNGGNRDNFQYPGYTVIDPATEEEVTDVNIRELETIGREMMLGGASEEEIDAFVGQRVPNVFGNGHPDVCLCYACAPQEYDYYPSYEEEFGSVPAPRFNTGIMGTEFQTWEELYKAWGIPE